MPRQPLVVTKQGHEGLLRKAVRYELLYHCMDLSRASVQGRVGRLWLDILGSNRFKRTNRDHRDHRDQCLSSKLYPLKVQLPCLGCGCFRTNDGQSGAIAKACAISVKEIKDVLLRQFCVALCQLCEQLLWLEWASNESYMSA